MTDRFGDEKTCELIIFQELEMGIGGTKEHSNVDDFFGPLKRSAHVEHCVRE